MMRETFDRRAQQLYLPRRNLLEDRWTRSITFVICFRCATTTVTFAALRLIWYRTDTARLPSVIGILTPGVRRQRWTCSRCNTEKYYVRGDWSWPAKRAIINILYTVYNITSATSGSGAVTSRAWLLSRFRESGKSVTQGLGRG
jgi:hypothetical protein